jgi:hypothetical protein
MWIGLRDDWRWLRRRSCHLGWRYANAHDDPIPTPVGRDPAGTGLCGSPPLDLSDRLITCHEVRIVPKEPEMVRKRWDDQPCSQRGYGGWISSE